MRGTFFLLQKSLLDSCQIRVDKREELKSLKNTCEKARQSLQEKEEELAAARAENQNLRLQVVTSLAEVKREITFVQIDIHLSS